MNYLFNQYWYDSKSELTEALRKNKNKTIWIGKDSENPRNFLMITVGEKGSKREVLTIGVCCQGHGIKPCIMQINNQLLLKCDFMLALISVKNAEVLKKEFCSLVYEAITLKGNNIIVICECDIYCLNKKLETIWQVGTDLIIGFEVLENHVSINLGDAIEKYSIKDGSKIA